MRRGFTILELLVASLLLSMLVTVLTMIFNQSSAAWKTGQDSVSRLQAVRSKLGGYHDVFDDALPGVGQDNVKDVSDNGRQIEYRTISLFRNWGGSGRLNAGEASRVGRAFDRIDWSAANLSSYQSQMADVRAGKESGSLGASVGGGVGSGGKGQSAAGGGAGNGDYIVGVRSSGPDRRMGTPDDINTFPEDVN